MLLGYAVLPAAAMLITISAMSPRKPAALRDRDGENLREHLIGVAARLLDERGRAGLPCETSPGGPGRGRRLYNDFEDKDDLLAHALLAHVATVMTEGPDAPGRGGTVAENLTVFIDRGMASLPGGARVRGAQSQPGVLPRFHAMVGGDGLRRACREDARRGRARRPRRSPGSPQPPEILLHYLSRAAARPHQAGADLDGASVLIVGAIHGQVLPRVLSRCRATRRRPRPPSRRTGHDRPARPGAPGRLADRATWPGDLAA